MKGPSDGLLNALSSKPELLGGQPGQERGLSPLQLQPACSVDKGSSSEAVQRGGMGAGLGSEAVAFETERTLTTPTPKAELPQSDLSTKTVLGCVHACSNNDTGTCLLLSMLV